MADVVKGYVEAHEAVSPAGMEDYDDVYGENSGL